MELRERTGLEMALMPSFRIQEDHGLWVVPSQTTAGKHYTVFLGSEYATCTCEDFKRHGPTCKHIWAVQYTLLKEDGEPLPELADLPPPDPPKKRFERDWPAIHESRRHEKKKFLLLLADLCSGLLTPDPDVEGGRPRLPLSDIVFGLVSRVYCRTPPATQFMHDYEDMLEKGYVTAKLCPNSLFNYMGKVWLTLPEEKKKEDDKSSSLKSWSVG